jgi:hypothetical protein
MASQPTCRVSRVGLVFGDRRLCTCSRTVVTFVACGDYERDHAKAAKSFRN